MAPKEWHAPSFSVSWQDSHNRVLHVGAQADCPTFSPGQSRTSVLQAAAMAAKWWEPPRDALDTMVLGAADLDALSGLRHVDFTPFDPTLKARSALSHLRFQQHGAGCCGPACTFRTAPHHLHAFQQQQ